MQLRYRLVNVFTVAGERLSGNPLCVFENGADLSGETMQRLARQFNLSETTFLLAPTTDGLAAGAHARVRIFTPSYEMPFAGHPTLGTAHVCRALGLGGDELALEMQAGIIPVSAAGDHWTLQAVAPTWREPNISTADLAGLLALEPKDVGERPLWVNAGREQLVVPLKSSEAVRRASPKLDILQRLGGGDLSAMVYVFAMQEGGRALARFFFPDGNALLEDPATGSATANLGGWLIATERLLPQRIAISQGESVARPSALQLYVDDARRVFVGGDVIALAHGVLEL